MSRLCFALMGYDPSRKVVSFDVPRSRPRLRTLLPLCVVCLLNTVTRPNHSTCSTGCAGTLRRRNKEKRARDAFRAAHAAKFLTFPKEIIHAVE